MTTPYILFADLATEAPIPARGSSARRFPTRKTSSSWSSPSPRASSFRSGYTSARPAIIHILEGEGELTVGGDPYPARSGTWLRMAPEVKHSLTARTPMRIALYLLPR